MILEIQEVKNRKDLRNFIRFPFSLYRNNPNWVPQQNRDEFEVFNQNKNPALALCKTRQWMVYRDGEVVGRIAGIIHEKEAANKKLARFGWIDFVDDIEVVKLLLNKVEEWVTEHHLEGIHGPMGFSDMDLEGMLVEGFDTPGTIATIYNFDYYPKHLEALGYTKAVDWVEAKGKIPKEPSKRLLRIAQIVENRFKVKSLGLTSRKQVAARGKELFEVLNECFKGLYGFQPLSEGQINYYIKMYLGFVIPELVSMVVNEEDKLVGFAVAMPSLTKAFQKAKGNLIPFGIFYILRALKKNDTVDLYLIGVLPEYQRMGVTSLIFRDLILAFNKRGYTIARTNIILEENMNMLTQFNEYQESTEMHKRRRCYVKNLDK